MKPLLTADGKYFIHTVGKQYRMTGNNMLCAPTGRAERTGRIFRAEAYSDDQTQYYVLAVGPGRRTRKGEIIPPIVKPGDKVLCQMHFSHHTLEDGTNRKIINCDQVIAIIP